MFCKDFLVISYCIARMVPWWQRPVQGFRLYTYAALTKELLEENYLLQPCENKPRYYYWCHDYDYDHAHAGRNHFHGSTNDDFLYSFLTFWKKKKKK